MPESIANLRKENNDLKSKVFTLTEEISRPKDLIQEQSSSDAPSQLKKYLTVLSSLATNMMTLFASKPLPAKSCND